MLENEENSNNTHDDGQSAEMNEKQENEVQCNSSDDTFQEDEDFYNNDDEEYQYEDDDKDEETYIKSDIGMQYDGNMNEIMKNPGTIALYPIYKQLSELCLVDIDINFYSAQLTIGINEQILMLTINFPDKEPYFPAAPPKILLQSKFKQPHQKYNILFNCHPLLLSSTWNICTDIIQIIKDIINIIADTSSIDTIDDAYSTNDSIERIIILLINKNSLDITSLFPHNIMNKLPSFGIIKQLDPSRDSESSNKNQPRGVGYSDGHGDKTESWRKPIETSIAQLDGLIELSKRVEKELILTQECKNILDPIYIDSIYFILAHTVSRTVPLEEFFRNISYYELVIECILPLPPPSEHIVPLQSLINVYNVIMSGQMSTTLEENEVVVLEKLKILKERFGQHKSSGRLTTTTEIVTTTSVGVDNTSSNNSRQIRDALSSKKRQLSATHPRQATTSRKSNSNGVDPTTASHSSSSTLLAHCEISRVTECEDAFVSHKYAPEMNKITHMSAKWYRRLYIELGTLPESLPENVLVFAGTQCAQPNLLKILMFPESRDCPYCGGGFIFDVFVPPDYPNIPPSVNLVTTGYGTVRFNPNLYNCGKVCLSLLGTWAGEKWNPDVSSLSQVINSILFLIFVEAPYFNEPGYQQTQGTPAGEQTAEKYNKGIRAATLRYAYLDHFKKPNAQLSKYILPMLCHNWRSKSHAVALQWAVQSPTLVDVINSIEEQVTALVGSPPAAPVQGMSGEKA